MKSAGASLNGVAALLLFGLALACSKPSPVETGMASPQAGVERAVAASKPLIEEPGVRVPAPALPGSERLPQAEATWKFESTELGLMSAVSVIPERAPGEHFPLLVTFHGMGEAKKGPERGARGWIDDYGLLRAIERLHHPPLTTQDFKSFADPERLAKLNAALARTPYQGLVIVNSYTPDVLRGDEPFSKAPPLAEFVAGTLLPRAARELPILATPQTTGIDGVSLGGRAALAVALLRPEAFASAGGLQAAFDDDDGPFVAERVRAARVKNPGLALRLLTSRSDYFLNANRNISAALTRASLAHQLVIIPGPHDYPFNQGPAVYEMLIHHDRVLRGLPPVE